MTKIIRTVCFSLSFCFHMFPPFCWTGGGSNGGARSGALAASLEPCAWGAVFREGLMEELGEVGVFVAVFSCCCHMLQNMLPYICNGNHLKTSLDWGLWWHVTDRFCMVLLIFYDLSDFLIFFVDRLDISWYFQIDIENRTLFSADTGAGSRRCRFRALRRHSCCCIWIKYHCCWLNIKINMYKYDYICILYVYYCVIYCWI